MCAWESERQLSPNPEKPLSSEVGIRRHSITICEAPRCAAERSCRTLFGKNFQSFFVRDAVSAFSLSAGGRVC